MKNRKSILIVVLLLAVGFAAVSTMLYINGQTKINPNQDDFNVYYSDAYVNGIQDKSVITDDTHISFTTELSTLGEKYVLDYEVTNRSKNYDAELIMECTDDNEYLTVTNEFDYETILEARNTRNGTLTLELKKSNAREDMDVTITCTIDANAIERTSLNENEIVSGTSYIIEGIYGNENGEALTNANLVIFSDTPHYVTTDSNGYLFYNGLERGNHEIYHVEDTLENIKKMTKAEIISNATSSVTFKTNQTENIIFDNSYKLKDLIIKESSLYCQDIIGETYEYNFSNIEQTFITKCDGNYKLETWGAQGGYAVSEDSYPGGYGAYSVGKIFLSKNEYLFLNTGGQGENGISKRIKKQQLGGYNGGGSGYVYGNKYVGAGGGATHIAKISGLLADLENYKGALNAQSTTYNSTEILIVSGGGGGSSFEQKGYYGIGGNAGGIKGNNSIFAGYTERSSGKGGTQLNSGVSVKDYPQGGFGFGAYVESDGNGAGSGWFGGGLSNGATGGGGGSSYIGNTFLTDKAMYCYNCEESSEIDTKTISIKCAEDIPTTNCAKKGNGYAKITYLGAN